MGAEKKLSKSVFRYFMTKKRKKKSPMAIKPGGGEEGVKAQPLREEHLLRLPLPGLIYRKLQKLFVAYVY